MRLLPFLLAAAAYGQVTHSEQNYVFGLWDATAATYTKPIKTVGADQSGSCTNNNQIVMNSTNGNLFACVGGTWVLLNVGGGGGGSVISVFGRTGTVVAVSGDYSFSLISGTATVAQGGTGATTLTGLLVGNGTSAVTAVTTSAGIASAISDETGSGALVLATSPTLVTPTLGVATATTVNKVTITAPATGSTLTIAEGKTLTISNSLTLAGTDSTTMTFPGSSATILSTAAAVTVAQGGTGATTLTGVLKGNGTWKSVV